MYLGLLHGLLTEEVLDRDDWSPGGAEEPQQEMSALVFGIWSFPSEEAPGTAVGELKALVEHDEGGAQTLDELPEVPE